MPRPGGEDRTRAAVGGDAPTIACPIRTYLERLHARHAPLTAGAVATYIPELAKADPDWFGICVATTDGTVYEVGDTRQPFTIQSISKPFVYGLALEDVGSNAVLARIGVEPTGDAFNSISLAPGTGRPLNPMINAGAIAATSLVAGHSAADRLHRVLTVLSLYAGRTLTVDDAVYASEKETGHRNRAIGHMLRNFDVLTDDPEAPLDLYFRQCSIAVDCRDLSLMAATLANGGVNPVTGERAVLDHHVESILSVMTTCGMYDYAGEWVYWVGMPAKSGVAGGVLAVLPGQLGIGVFSPRLDARGNSVRGVAVCKDLSRDWNLHFLRVPRSARAGIRAEYSLARVGSRRRRNDDERRALDTLGTQARVFHLQGDLAFSVLETLARRLVDRSGALRFAVLDLERATEIDTAAVSIFTDLIVSFGASGGAVVFVDRGRHASVIRRIDEALAAAERPRRGLNFQDLDVALEWCENRLLAGAGLGTRPDEVLSLARHALCRGLDEDQLGRLDGLLVRERFGPGQRIVGRGDPADKIYLIVGGEVSVVVALAGQRPLRLSTLSAGMTFGELAVIAGGMRSADVVADGDVECLTLSRDAFVALGTTHPAIKLRLLENLLANVSHMLARADQEIAALTE
jgi:glutaminase